MCVCLGKTGGAEAHRIDTGFAIVALHVIHLNCKRMRHTRNGLFDRVGLLTLQ